MTNIVLDDNVLSKQQEWGSLLQLDDLTISELPPCPLTSQERLYLSTLWLHDGTKGGNIDFPQTTYQLTCYEYTRSHNSLLFFSAVFFVHLSFPFFEQPYCAWVSNGQEFDYNQQKSTNYLSPRVATILELLCLIYYYLEIYLRLAINPGARSRRGLDFYTKFRLVVVILLTWDCLVSLISTQPERMVRALLPIVYITRRKSLRQMCWGLLLVAYKCIPVFLLLITIVLAWSYLGRMIFGNLELDGSDKFGSLVSAFLTTLESYSCRSYVIFVLDPLFQINASSSLFFVSLTIFADIFCQALIVATGTRQYQLYSATVFRKELLNRKKAMLAIFGILQQRTQELVIESFIKNQSSPLQGESSHLQEATTTSEQQQQQPPQDHSFNSRPNSMRSIFDPFSRTPKFWENRKSSESSRTDSISHQMNANNRESLYDPRADSSNLRISKKAWLEFCSFLTGKKKISPELAELLFDKEMEIEDSRHLATSHNSWGRDSFTTKKQSTTTATATTTTTLSSSGIDGLSLLGFFRLAALLDGEINIEGDIDSDDESDEGEPETNSMKPTFAVKRPTTKRSSSESFRMPTKHSLDPSLGIMLANNHHISSNQTTTDDHSETLLHSKQPTHRYFTRLFKWIYKKSRIFARFVAETEIILDFTIPFLKTRSLTRHGVFDAIVAASRILLAVQLLYITMTSSPSYWDNIGWGLQGFFWFEMYIRIASIYSKRRRRNIRLFLINFITTVLYSTINRSKSHSEEISGRMIAYICFQWFRLLQVVLPFRISNVIRGLLPLVSRVVFIVFSVIYFFSTIGFYRFCNAFDGNEAETVDDFAEKWASYDRQLNFNTMLQTLYTLFEVAVLGSWSYVMRAAMLSGFLSALLFFYAYRLVMTLVVIPILTSFIIQAFNARSIKIMNEERLLLEKKLQQKENNGNGNGNGNENENGMNQESRNINSILEVDETSEDAAPDNDPSAADREGGEGGGGGGGGSERNTDLTRVSRLTDGTFVSQKSEKRLLVTRVMSSNQSMISFWSATGTEHANPTNKPPPPPPSRLPVPSSASSSSTPSPSSVLSPRHSSTTSPPSPSPSPSQHAPSSLTSSGLNQHSLAQSAQERDQINTLNEMTNELNKTLQAYESLKQQTEKLMEENRLLKTQMGQFTTAFAGTDDNEIDEIGI